MAFAGCLLSAGAIEDAAFFAFVERSNPGLPAGSNASLAAQVKGCVSAVRSLASSANRGC